MEPQRLYVYVDADYASSDVDTRKSLTGYIIYFNGGIISWKTSTQKSNSSSTTEAEYKALHTACVESIWLHRILTEMNVTHQQPIIIYEDNTSTIRAANNPVEFSRLKHVDTLYHAIRDFMETKLIALVHVASALNHADTFTKALGSKLFRAHREQFLSVTTSRDRLDLMDA